ncbi:NADH dehydrogenase subunit 2 [Striga asiatica]|uniref:NADH dehydrogenase subunit 2 n=1 Tax=Striga asiatica TaxID=4170 RepID=A0A5A7Q2B8_STRAF|nr:NADH dehydrogenase subunit 2 [Striga asiatica]
MGMHATKDRVESDTSTVYSISLYESTITTRDEPSVWTPSYCARSYTEVLPAELCLAPLLMKGLRCNGWQRVRSTRSTGVIQMFFDTPRTWILYSPMDRDKSLLLAMTSSFITSFFPYPSPLFSVTHQMALSSYL